jgi:nitrite reductase/ring-hydroxylating ferredoxin subunit/DMSO/TMAO reductase YedYZ heme-binding membrane subunit
MSAFYQAVGWNRQKTIYDGSLAAGVFLYLGIFVGVGARLFPDVTAETLLIRGLGTAALVLLHLVLCIGPLARIDRRFLPLLYNRRHLGVMTFALGLAHASFALIQFHSGGDANPLVSVLTGNPRVSELGQFPFEPLGLIALVILFLMAATSHDFWLANLTAPVWKTLHMLVYLAYGLLIAHVTLGVLQAETSPVLAGALVCGVVLVVGLHLTAGLSGRAVDRETGTPVAGGWVDICAVDDIEDTRARVACVGGERLAVFRYDGKLSCVSSVCQHQNGPLGEGRVIDGLITCPWHGYQYCPDNGASPAPFTERIPTFAVRVVAGRVQVDPVPRPPGTRVEPARIDGSSG